MTSGAKPAPRWLCGLWRRRSLVVAGAPQDDDEEAWWGQTPTAFVDLRVPATPTADPGRLARQEGFAGHVVVSGGEDGALCRWVRRIDFQPPGTQDAAAIRREGDTLLEAGPAPPAEGEPYEETFELVSDGRRGMTASASACGRALLVTIDDRYLLAWDPRPPLPPAASLAALLGQGGDAAAMLSCEIVLGALAPGWPVLRSTAPGLSGAALGARLAGAPGRDLALLPAGAGATPIPLHAIATTDVPCSDLSTR